LFVVLKHFGISAPVARVPRSAKDSDQLVRTRLAILITAWKEFSTPGTGSPTEEFFQDGSSGGRHPLPTSTNKNEPKAAENNAYGYLLATAKPGG